MRYLSVCSGIEAASVAWKPLGWECAGVSEIDKFPRAVLQHRLGAVPVDDDHRWQQGQNFTPLFGDFTKIEAHHVGPVDLLVGGTPCQSFSIAGKRLGLDDPRGNLTLEFFALAERVRPRWIVWENVPGVLSHDEGRTFGTVLGLMGECGFRWAYRVLDAQYVRVGRFGRAVPQRRRRVFLVGYSGAADINPAAVLFDRESLRGNPAPRREAGQGTAAAARSGAESGRGSVEAAFRWQNEQAGIVEDDCAASLRAKGTTTDERSVGAYVAQSGLGTEFDCDGGLIAGTISEFEVCGTLSDGAHMGGGLNGQDAYTGRILPVAHALRGEGFDASEDGTGRVTPIVPVAHPIAIQERAVSENPDAGPDGKGWRDDGDAYTLEARQVSQAVAFAQNTRDEVRLFNGDGSIAGALAAEPGMKQTTYVAQPVDSAFTFNTTQLTSPQNGQDLGPDKPCHSLSAKDHPPAVAIAFPAEMSATQCASTEELSPALSVKHTTAVAYAEPEPFTIMERGRNGESNLESRQDGTANAILTPNGGRGGLGVGAIAAAWGVRRLTPRECERLMGFPDDFTLIPWRGKDAENCPDGPRYKALGNSMAVNVMCFIGERIDAVRVAIET